MDADQILLELGSRLNLGTTRFAEDGSFLVTFDKTIAVEIERVGTKVIRMTTSIAELPDEEERAKLLERLLQANLLGQGTGGAVLAVDPTMGEVVLHRSLPTAVTDGTSFMDALERFVGYAQNWREHIIAHGGTEPLP